MLLRQIKSHDKKMCLCFISFMLLTMQFPKLAGASEKENKSANLSDYDVIIRRYNMPRENITKTQKRSENSRTLMINHKMLVPLLIGVLLKVAATIPLILAIAAVIGTVSLISSKLSLLISTLFGMRTMYMEMPSVRTDQASIPSDEVSDLKHIMSNNHETHNNLHYSKKSNTIPDMHQNFYRANQAQAQMSASPQYDPNVLYWNHDNLANSNLYHSENYFSSPTAAAKNPYEAVKNDQVAIDDASNIASVHALQKNEHTDGDKANSDALSADRAKWIAAVEMARRANMVLKTQAMENPNRRTGVKIIKTIIRRGRNLP